MKLKAKLFFLGLSSSLLASDYLPSYNGNTGIFETPNARIMPDWSMRFYYNRDQPFTYYGATITPLPFLETNFHMTQLDGKAGFTNNSGYGDQKDKSINLKYLLKKEGEYTPSIVFGADDIWGTGLYTSKYFVASKKIGYFNFTLGYAKGRLGGEDLNKYKSSGSNTGALGNRAFNFIKDLDWSGGKPFGSVVFNATPSLSFMAEYSPIDYIKDSANPFTISDKYNLPDSKFNYGLKYKWSDNSILSLSYQRGNTLSFGYTYQFGFDRTGVFEHIPDKKWRANDKIRDDYEKLNEEDLRKKLANEIAAENFYNVSTAVNDDKIWAEISNTRYNNDLKAVSRSLTTINEVSPKKYETIYMTLKDGQIPRKTFKVNRKEFDLFEKDKLSNGYMKEAIEISNYTQKKFEEFKADKKFVKKTNLFAKDKFEWNVAPKIRTYLNHEDKPFALKLSARVNASYNLTDNINIAAAIEHPLYNGGKDLSSKQLESDELSIRSDITKTFTYNSTQMPYFVASYKDKLFDESFYKIEAGYLEYAFAGLDLEWYKPLFNERFGVGLQYQNVYKREVDDLFKLKTKRSYDAAFVNLFYQAVPKYNINVGAKIGKFLAGDKGISIDVARHYKDFTLGAFATFTDSKNVFKDDENRGYIDKGVYIKIPLEVFTYKNLKKRVLYSFKPWTRDVGQYASTLDSLYPMNDSENNTQIMKNNIKYLKY